MDRAAMAWRIIDELLGSCPEGEAIDTEKVLSQYPDLKPELQEELVKVKRIQRAREEAAMLAQVSDYRLLRRIGGGGGGVVYLGENKHTGGYLAIKLVRRSKSVELDGIGLYKDRLPSHPHLVPIPHVGATDKFFYYTMPLAEDVRGPRDVRPPE